MDDYQYSNPFRSRYSGKRCADCRGEILANQLVRFRIGNGTKILCHADCVTAKLEYDHWDREEALKLAATLRG
jgi:hypothetical protein